MFEDSKRQNPSGDRHRPSAAMDELRRRLSRLGVVTGQDFVPKPRLHASGNIEELVNGAILETPDGPSFRVTRYCEPDALHGPVPLSDWLRQDGAVISRVGGIPHLSQTSLHRFIFLDTETTGLSAGTGVFAFLVGIGFFNERGAFEVHQFFLRDPAEERAMLVLLRDILAHDCSLVTFNGRTFDVPLLMDRYVMSRLPSSLGSLPNLDLLHPARRLWKRRLASCRLSALESDILGMQRDSADVPGSLIPYLYRQYLQTGDGREMTRVLYHNEQDILSMVALGVVLCRVFEQPAAPSVPVEDRLSLARWYEQRGMFAECEAAYRAAIEDDSDGDIRCDALAGLALLLRRARRYDEAVAYWEYLADLNLNTIGHEALAKYYEWQAADLPKALHWTEAGLRLADSWGPGLRRAEATRLLEHRRARLLTKIDQRTQSRESASREVQQAVDSPAPPNRLGPDSTDR